MLYSFIAKKDTFSRVLQHALAFPTSRGVEFSLNAYVSIVAKELYLSWVEIYMHFSSNYENQCIPTQWMHHIDVLYHYEHILYVHLCDFLSMS